MLNASAVLELPDGRRLKGDNGLNIGLARSVEIDVPESSQADSEVGSEYGSGG